MKKAIHLAVPRIKQPNPVACLPAAVWVVVTHQGYSVGYEEIAAACRMDANGSVQEIALDGLREAGFDVEVLSRWDEAAVVCALEEGRPLIVSGPDGGALRSCACALWS